MAAYQRTGWPWACSIAYLPYRLSTAARRHSYLNEFVFRFNRREMPWVAFNRALGLAALTRPAVEYEGLYKHTWRHPTSTVMPMT